MCESERRPSPKTSESRGDSCPPSHNKREAERASTFTQNKREAERESTITQYKREAEAKASVIRLRKKVFGGWAGQEAGRELFCRKNTKRRWPKKTNESFSKKPNEVHKKKKFRQGPQKKKFRQGPEKKKKREPIAKKVCGGRAGQEAKKRLLAFTQNKREAESERRPSPKQARGVEIVAPLHNKRASTFIQNNRERRSERRPSSKTIARGGASVDLHREAER